MLTPVIGQTLDLTGLQAAYGIRGTSIYSKGLFTASVASWLDLYGQFLYSQPESNVNYQEAAAGNLYLQSQVLFYSSEQFLLSAAAKMPHTTASLGAEMRPLRRVRVTESWLTDRLHNAGSAGSNQLLSGTGISQQTAALLASSLATNYNQVEIDVFFDATSKLTLRGGYRYVWGEASDVILPPAGLASSDQGKQRSNVGLGGRHVSPDPQAVPHRRGRKRIERRSVFPHQPLRLSEGSCTSRAIRPPTRSASRPISGFWTITILCRA